DIKDSASSGQAESPGDVFDMVRPALERLARQLERTIDHSVNVLSHPAPERIYICGGISFLPGLAEFFSEQLGIPAVIMDMDMPGPETGGAGGRISLQDSDERLSLVSAAALAMPSDKTINFLRTAIDRDKEREALRNTNAVAAACALLFVLTASWWWMARHDLEQTRKHTAQVRQQLEQYSPVIQSEDLARLAAELEGKKDELRTYSRKLRPVAVFKELNQLTPQHIELLNIQMDTEAGGNKNGKDKAGTLMVEGFIRSDPSLFETHLTGYLLRLRRSPLFRDSSIRKSSQDTLNTGDNVFRFTINLDLAQV
ncbi:MAG: PilN domain-containing protein, partial [Desulfosalsimonas sp.]